MKKTFLTEPELAALAKKSRQASGRRKAEVARELKVSPPSLYNAEERPEMSLHKLRTRIIEAYTDYKVVGPVYYLERK